jgi:sialic acid synthase SpsE
MARVKITNRNIGDGEPCFVIAEAGVNHNGDIRLAKKLIDVAKDAGADAVKFQTYKSEDVATVALGT